MKENNTINLSFERVLMNGISDIVFVMRVENKSEFIYEFLNQAAMDKMNLTKDVLGKSIHDIFPNKRGDFLYDQYKKVVTSRDTIIYEDSYRTPSGEKHYSKTELIPFFNEQKECIQIVATIKDITKKKQEKIEKLEAWERMNESNKRYQSLFNHNPDAIFALGLDGRITRGNAAVKNVTGYTPIDLIGSTLYSLVVKDDIDIVKRVFIQAVGGITENCQIAIVNKKGNRIDVSLKVIPLIIDNEVVGIYGILRDVTDFIKSERKLRESEERFRIIAENANDLITLLNDKGEIIYASPSYEKILGFDYKEYIGKLFLHNINPDDQTQLSKEIIHSINNGENFKTQFRQFNREGELIWCEANGMPVWDNNKFEHMVVLTRDIQLQKEYESNLNYFAHHDFLTGLPNRVLFNKHFAKALEAFHEHDNGLAVIMMDIDHFKEINDTMGHDIGDKVIEEFGKRVSKAIRDNDIVARLGGDEFSILLPSIGSKENAIAIAKDILKVMQEKWHLNDNVLKVTTSMGIAMAPSEGATRHTVMKNADLALYEAKNAGRNSFKFKDFQPKELTTGS